MDVPAIQKAQIVELVVEAFPQGFWEELGALAKTLYSGVFEEVAADPECLQSQRMSLLWQKRHFRMEALVVRAAKNHGVAASEEKIVTNRCAYAYLCPGRVAMTQSYVPETGRLPRPARFRRVLAAMNEFARAPELAFGDKIFAVHAPKVVAGILIHSPVGYKFEASAQRLGALGFYVPFPDYSGWVVNLSLTEILAGYKPVARREDKALPTFKKPAATAKDSK